MFKLICVTQMSSVNGDFNEQLEKICRGGADRIILREKQLSENEYSELAVKVIDICRRYDTPLSLHSFTETAKKLGHRDIHLPFNSFMNRCGEGFDTIGVSVHSAEEAVLAEKSGASYITAGHIFATDCKKGLPPRGTDFLSEVCRSVSIPVFAIGGINAENAAAVKASGASGACIMSGLMKSVCPEALISSVKSI